MKGLSVHLMRNVAKPSPRTSVSGRRPGPRARQRGRRGPDQGRTVAPEAHPARAGGTRGRGGGWRSETHVIAALWSSEVLHSLRLRTASFEAVCPDPPNAFAAWWSGEPPAQSRASCLVVLDPDPGGPAGG